MFWLKNVYKMQRKCKGFAAKKHFCAKKVFVQKAFSTAKIQMKYKGLAAKNFRPGDIFFVENYK